MRVLFLRSIVGCSLGAVSRGLLFGPMQNTHPSRPLGNPQKSVTQRARDSYAVYTRLPHRLWCCST